MSEFSGTTEHVETIQEKGVRAAERYLILRGFDVYNVNPMEAFQIVAFDSDKDTLHFIHVNTNDQEMSFEEASDIKPDLQELEERMLSWLKENKEFNECVMMGDDINIVVVAEHKALLRHHVNAYK